MKHSMKSTLAILTVAIISIGISALLYMFKSPPKRKATLDKRPLIEMLTIQNTSIPVQVPIIGKLTAKDKISIYAEVSGVLEESDKEFLAGQHYNAGEVMLRIKDDEAELNLKSKRSDLLTAVATLLPELKLAYPKSYKAWSDFITNCNINQKLNPLPQILEERERFMVAGKGIPRRYYEIKALEARLDKYLIIAPFDGSLINHSIRTGDLVRSGQELGVFIDPREYEMEAMVSRNDMNTIHINDMANLSADPTSKIMQGSVKRVNQGIDPKTQMFSVYISIFDNSIYEGMYLSGTITTSTSHKGMKIPRTMLLDNSSVLIYEVGKVKRQSVNIVAEQGEYVIVTDLADGVMVSTRVQNLRSGQDVRIAQSDTTKANPSSKKSSDKKSSKN